MITQVLESSAVWGVLLTLAAFGLGVLIISLLSPEYLLSVERWPFHSEPPDHYDLLSHLLAPSRSQSSWLMPLH